MCTILTILTTTYHVLLPYLPLIFEFPYLAEALYSDHPVLAEVKTIGNEEIKSLEPSLTHIFF